jgi:hypothetical protein
VYRAVETISPIPTALTRAECCQLCANTYNCLWWQHSASGACTYVWATDVEEQSPYDVCPNGDNGTTEFIGTAPLDQPDSYGPGTCAVGIDFWGEDQSNADSAEVDFKFQDMCAVFGGEYCGYDFFIP